MNDYEKSIYDLIKQKQINDYLGIIVYGSYINGLANDLSDLDIMIIKKQHNTSDCGSIIINGIRVEYFIQDINNLYYSIKQQTEDNDPSHLTKFATCRIIVDKTGEIKELVSFAQKLYLTKILPSFTDEERFAIFSIKNRLDDLTELVNKPEFYSIYYVILEKIRILYTKTEGLISLPLTKYTKLVNCEELYFKYVSDLNHQMPCEQFIILYNRCLQIDNNSLMLDSILDLYHFCFDKYKFNTNNFQLCYKKNPPWKV